MKTTHRRDIEFPCEVAGTRKAGPVKDGRARPFLTTIRK
jgi:hypothetical protein